MNCHLCMYNCHQNPLCVTISYLDGSTFLLCVFHCTFFPLDLTTFTEGCYTLWLSSYSVHLMLYPADAYVPVPFLLLLSWVGCVLLFLIIPMSSLDLDCYLDFQGLLCIPITYLFYDIPSYFLMTCLIVLIPLCCCIGPLHLFYAIQGVLSCPSLT